MIIEFIISWFNPFLSITSLVYFLTDLGCGGLLILISIIYLASRGTKVLDTASKVVTISTGSTVLYNNWVKDDSSGSSEDKDENKTR
jgi:hypothetical protein